MTEREWELEQEKVHYNNTEKLSASYTKTRDHIIAANLKAATGIKGEFSILEDLIAAIDALPEEAGFPFLLRNVRVVYDRVQVLSEVMLTKKKSFLLDMLHETPDQKLLVTDPNLSGKNSLFFCWLLDHPDEVGEIVRRLRRPSIMLNTYNEDTFVAVPITAYI